ncbi:MAG: hypothetical protein PF570_06830 [Candidatus Cloacimonetes bacterium]|jgi:hypothetical protein|nr:hypothetical protein [Candidatus Cloacimonadota bacterium]
MKLKEFLKLMKMPLLIIGIVLSIFSFLSYFFGFQLTLVKDTGFLTKIMYNLFYHLDYTHDITFAAWFTSLVLLFCALGLLLIGWGDREKLKISPARQGIIKLFSLIMLLLSVDEILVLRDQLGQNLKYSTGLLVYIPLALIGMVAFILVFNQLIKNIRTVKNRALTNIYFRAVILLALIYFILLLGEGYLRMSGYPIQVIPYIKGFVKLGMIYGVYSLLLKISDNYNL